MKKLSFLISFLCIFTTFVVSARSINITAPNGVILYIDDTTTVAQLFRECRNQGFCDSTQRLLLYFGDYEIIENSEASNKPLWHFGNHVEYAAISYYQQTYNNYPNINYQTRAISICAPNGVTTTFRADQTPAYFFRVCRNAGNCSSTLPMTLKFGIYEIKENTVAANKYFYEFNTDTNYAYVMYWDYNSNLNNAENAAAAILGTAICGVGFLYFLNILTK